MVLVGESCLVDIATRSTRRLDVKWLTSKPAYRGLEQDSLLSGCSCTSQVSRCRRWEHPLRRSRSVTLRGRSEPLSS